MELKTRLREHFVQKGNGSWEPKRAFLNEDEIKNCVGFNPLKCRIYKCSYCGYLHIGSPKWKKSK